VTGGPFPSIAVSPAMLARIGQLPVELYYLTDWAPEDTPFFDQYLGRSATHLNRHTTKTWPWWKLDVLDAHLTSRPDIDRIIFADDKLTETGEGGLTYDDHLQVLLSQHREVTASCILYPYDGIVPADLDDIDAFLAATPSDG
jgi:hypothetical protein